MYMQKNNFDFLRFILAFIVVIGHIIVVTEIDDFQKYKSLFNTYISVTGFFCISGFLITRSYINSGDLKDYIIKRGARLLPAYFVVILICFFGFSLISTYSIIDYFTNLNTYKYLIANLSFLNFLKPILPGVFLRDSIEYPINGALWTLKIEIAFYILLPFFLNILTKSNNKILILCIVYVTSILYRYYFNYQFDNTNIPIYLVLAHQLPAFLSYFVCGIALHFFFEYFTKWKKHLFFCGLIIYTFEYALEIEVLSPVALSFILFAIAFSNLKLTNFGKFGDISYGIYIYHFPIINLAIYFGLFESYNSYIVALLLILFIISISFLSWHLLEKKYISKAHRLVYLNHS